MSESAVHEREIAAEQRHLDVFYFRLDQARERAAASLDQVRRSATAGTPAALAERDAFAELHTERLATLRAVEERLCFGRLDLVDGEHRYVGRIGLHDDDGTQLLVDWRAPAAEAFYRATAAQPQGVMRRRHVSTTGRTVTGVEDDVLDLEAFERSGAERAGVSGDGALMLALDASRTGRMRDIVATIQGEQDRIIRSELGGVLVVEGGPGTGKTAVALHRAAFLLYAHRERIAKSGVLLVGPSPVFLRYVEQVLPALGETGVLMRTPARLFPGVDATGTESAEAAALKGDLRMAAVVASAVRERQRVPARPLRLDVDGTVITLRPGDVAAARDRARRTRKPHNEARTGFVKDVLNRLVGRLAAAHNTELDPDTRSELLVTLRESRDVRREVNLCWMPVDPRKLISDLFADDSRLRRAAPWLTDDQRALLIRDRDHAWTVADVPLLDEAAELLGEDDTADRIAAARAASDRASELEYAKDVLRMSGTGDMITADALVDRWAVGGDRLTVAERAADDRTWTFGHVVVDEAQELSPMAWRLLMRRCPARSMTIVGDLAQTSVLGGADAWADVLDPFVEGRWRREQLTVNYRTPRQVMELASAVLRAAGIEAPVPTSPRDGRTEPTAVRVDASGIEAAVIAAIRADLDEVGDGTVAVLAAESARDVLDAAVRAAFPDRVATGAADGLDAQVSVLTVRESKGLEFDTVVLVEPAAVVAASPRGVNDLYVGLTRPTQRLTVVHADDLPPGFGALG